ncbi:MAG TPA: hypothetical protein VJJ51_00015 [Candidatus Methanoperedens sp.]|nr:hypothetical protein [Candidatus Methanoperedens sp.]
MTEIEAMPEGWEIVRLGAQSVAIQTEKILAHIYQTRMTWIGRIFTDIFNPRVSASSAQSAFYRIPPIIDDGKKPQMNADERRLISSVHSKGRKERKAMQQETLRSGVIKIRYGINNELERTDTNSDHSEFVRVRISSLLMSILLFSLRPWSSLRLNAFSTPAHERAPPAPAVRPWTNRAEG